jgi:hypothetical protein
LRRGCFIDVCHPPRCPKRLDNFHLIITNQRATRYRVQLSLPKCRLSTAVS